MLFTDAPIITVDDITNADSEVIRIASVENVKAPINIQTICDEAIQQAGNTLVAEFQGLAYDFVGSNLQIAGGYLGLLGASYDSTPPARITLGQIVTDDDTTTFDSPLKRYVTYLGLKLFYLAAVGRKDPKTDKYETRLNVICHQLEKYWKTFKGAGLPVVYNPLPCPGALYELNTGSWNASNVTLSTGGTSAAGTYDIAITWLRGTTESFTSARVTVTTQADQLINVSIASLVAPANVTGWNVYAGLQNGTLYQQATIPINTLSFAFVGSPANSGTQSGRGQAKDTSLTFINGFFRG